MALELKNDTQFNLVIEATRHLLTPPEEEKWKVRLQAKER